MEFKKMVTITLYARQQKRHRCIEQSSGLCGSPGIESGSPALWADSLLSEPPGKRQWKKFYTGI